jgi:2-isopropylmalate synthase
VLSKHSGRHALRDRIEDLGFEIGEDELNRVFEDFKTLADKKKELFDGDIEALVLRSEYGSANVWSLKSLSTTSGSGVAAHATVALRHVDGRESEQSASGDGPVDAAFKAIEEVTGIRPLLRKFELRSVSEGEDAQGEASVYVEHSGRSYRGTSISTDIVESATRAFLEVINRIELAQRSAAQRSGEDRSGVTRAAQAAV